MHNILASRHNIRKLLYLLFSIEGFEAQSRQYQANVRSPTDAIVFDWWSRWFGANVGMGSSAGGLHTKTAGHVCQSNKMPILTARQ